MMVDVLGQLAAGLRMALALLAALVLLSYRPKASDAVRADDRAWTLMAIAALAFSPARAAYLLDAQWMTLVIKRSGDVVASALGCAAFTLLLIRRARQAGADDRRVRRIMAGSVLVATAMCAAAAV